MLTDPSIEKLKAKSASPYDLAVLVSKRARELTDGAQPMVDDTDAANVVSLACREVAADKIVAVEGDVSDQVIIPITREEKIRRNKFDLEDFLNQMRQINKLGGLGKIIDMIPGISAADKKNIDLEQGRTELRKMEAIILSMTPEERRRPNVLNASRRKRIAAGSGQTVQSVNQLIKKYEEMKKMTKIMANPNSKKARGMLRNLGM